jgi:hypothetical protein
MVDSEGGVHFERQGLLPPVPDSREGDRQRVEEESERAGALPSAGEEQEGVQKAQERSWWRRLIGG